MVDQRAANWRQNDEPTTLEAALIAALQDEPIDITDQEWQHRDVFSIALERV